MMFVVCFGHFKIALVDCSDWGLIRILKGVIGQKKKDLTVETASWGTRTPPERNAV